MESGSNALGPPGFPNLHQGNHEVTSPSNRRYNCIAWTAGDETSWWWPDPDNVAYWPAAVSREETIEAFVDAYRTLGYTPCADGELELGYEKVALYALQGVPTHAARQLTDGRWSSKLGRSVDVAHSPEALDGPLYGMIVVYLRRLIVAVPPGA
jgi:hypothetical protein